MSSSPIAKSKINVFPVIYIDLYPSETRSNVISSLERLLTFLETNASFPFSFALTIPSIISLKEYKGIYSRLIALLKEERCSLVGTCYSSSMHRETFPTRHYQLTWPKEYYKEVFDIEPKFFWVPDNMVDSVSFSILQEMGYTHCLFDHRIYSQLLKLSSDEDESKSKTPITGIWPITDFRILGVSGLDLTLYGTFRSSSSNIPFFQSIPSPSRLINRLLKQIREEASVSILGLYFDLNWFDAQFYLPTSNGFSSDSFLLDLLEELKDHEKINFISPKDVEEASINEYTLSTPLPSEAFQLLSYSPLSGIHDWRKTPNTVFWHKKASLIEKQLSEAEETIKQMTVSDVSENSEKTSASEKLLRSAWELFLISQSKIGFLGSGDAIGFHNGIISYHKRWERMKLAILYMQASISKLISPSTFSTFEDLLGIGSLQLHAGSSKLSFILATKYGARITHLFNRETGIIYSANDVLSDKSDFSFSDYDIGIFADNYSEKGFPLYTLGNEAFACSQLTKNSWIFSKLIANELIVSKHYELDNSEAIIKLTYGFQNILDKPIIGEFETYSSFAPDSVIVLKEGSNILEASIEDQKSKKIARIINTKTNNQVEIEIPADFNCSFEKITYAVITKLTLNKLELRPGEEQFYTFKLKFS
ncbi:MAG: hypothetical protein ACTSYA_11815 [Candidatus Kariarchaeaceae archaeon]